MSAGILLPICFQKLKEAEESYKNGITICIKLLLMSAGDPDDGT